VRYIIKKGQTINKFYQKQQAKIRAIADFFKPFAYLKKKLKKLKKIEKPHAKQLDLNFVSYYNK
jgi:hypothetical protein